VGVNPPRRRPEQSEGMTPFLSSLLFPPFFTCHPEAKPKGLLRGFFPFASLRVRMTEKGRSEKDEILHSADAPFRMTEKKEGQNDRKGE